MAEPHTPRHPISILILTKDEQVNIQRCLDCLSFSDDIVVFDSRSTDKTVEIAREHPAVRVVERPFDNWSSHQNWAVRNIDFRHPWVLYVDADERVPPDLAQEVMRCADPSSECSAYRMRRKDMFMGRWIRRATLYPTWLVRMFRPERIRYERLVNPIAVVDGRIGDLRSHLVHYPFSKGIVQWFDRHNDYSSYEMREQMKVMAGHRRPVAEVLSRDPNRRRAALKDVFIRLPFRPHLKWLYHMVWRRAFLDGRPGWTYARLQFIYEYMIAIKVSEALAEGHSARDYLEDDQPKDRAPLAESHAGASEASDHHRDRSASEMDAPPSPSPAAEVSSETQTPRVDSPTTG